MTEKELTQKITESCAGGAKTSLTYSIFIVVYIYIYILFIIRWATGKASGL